ncbi:MAG TPA: MFS transporter [Thermotogota bacterium]|nr:MFS transporter [Thermotogota bacterium]HPJ88651.1 MFS transporter [Thermotogota bacterium]HPR95811.1 MFS transporter [Thermotogota bacterium]
MSNLKKGKGMNYPQIFVLGFGFFGVSLIWSLYNAFVPIFLKGFAMSSMMIGFIMTFDNILAVILQPYIGFLSDNTRTKIGKRKPFILIGAPLGALFFFLIPFMKDYTLFWLIGIIILMNFAMAVFRSPVIALMPDIVPSKDRSKANGIINFMGGFGSLLAFFVGGMLFDMNPTMPFMTGAVALVISSALVLIFVREPKSHLETDGKVEKVNFAAAFKSLFKSLKELVTGKEKSELFILLAIFFWFCGFGTLETFFTIYGTQFLEVSAGSAAFALGLFSLMFMIFAIPAGFIGNKFGRKKTIMMGLIILIICLFAVSMIPIGSLTSGICVLDEIYKIPRTSEFSIIQLILVFGGIGWACININSLPMVVDMVSEDKVGGHTGLYYFFSMLAAIVAPPLVGAVIDYLSYPSMIKFSVLAFLCALICILFVRKGEAKKGVV